MNLKMIAHLVMMNIHQSEIDDTLLTLVQIKSKCEYIQMLTSISIRERLAESILHRRLMQDVKLI